MVHKIGTIVKFKSEDELLAFKDPLFGAIIHDKYSAKYAANKIGLISDVSYTQKELYEYEIYFPDYNNTRAWFCEGEFEVIGDLLKEYRGNLEENNMELNNDEIDKFIPSNELDIPDTEPQPTGVRPITSDNQELYSLKLNHIKSVDVQTGTIYIDYDMIKKEKSILEELNEMYDSIDRFEAKCDKYLEGYRDALNDAINVVERYLRGGGVDEEMASRSYSS